MSKAYPFPSNSRRTNPPSLPYDGAPNISLPNSTTLPLSINRAPSRPMTPSNSSSPPTNAASPARPVRSNMRPRQLSQYSQSSISSRTVSRDSTLTSRSETPSSQRARTRPGMNGAADEHEVSPNALSAVMNAFQQAGASRKRAMTNGTLDRERDREQELDEEMKRQRRIREKAPGRRPNGKSRAVGDIDAILDQIKDDWDFVIDPDFNPVDLALQLLDSSSVGKDIDAFRQTKLMLSRALKGSVDKNYQAFAAALPHHASLLNHLGTVQNQTTDARTTLQEAKDALGNKRSDLVQLWSRGQTIEEMLRLLDQIEHLKSVPDALESLMSEKRLLQASVLLVRSLKTISKQDMLEIGAVADLRSYLNGQENALREILVDEIHSHLYLKTFWCETRWSSYTPGQQTLPRVEFDSEPLSSEIDKVSIAPTSPCPLRLTRFLNDLALRPNDPPYDLADTELGSRSNNSGLRSFSLTSISSFLPTPEEPKPSRNPESDSFAYLETLLESLAVLSKLGGGLDIIAQRLPSEISSLVETTLDEVNERAEIGRRMSTYSSVMIGRPSSVYVFANEQGPINSSVSPISASSLRLAALESTEKQIDHEILRDLFWTLYSKLDAVTQGLRVIYEVANRIGSRRDFRDSSGAKPGTLFPLIETWLPIQTEVRTLLNDYLSDESTGSAAGRNPMASINEILRDGKFMRDRSKQVFRFADTAARVTTKALREHEEELLRVLKETVPGLVQGSSDSAVQTTLSRVGTEDRLIGAERHRLLITPDAFHVGVLFQPTLAFLDRVADQLPSGVESARASTVVLEEFVLNVYLPQLEEKTSVLFHQAVTGSEAFQADPSSVKLSPQPLIKASTQLMALINSLCAMLRATPFHRENYARLILGVIIQFYQRCSDRFYAIVSRSVLDPKETHLLASVKWAQEPELNASLVELMSTLGNDESRQRELCSRETYMEMSALGEHTVTKEDLLPSTRDVSSLGSLYRSITWFTEQLNALKSTAEAPLTPGTPFTPQLFFLPPFSSNEKLRLPLSREMALRFDALLKTYDQLAQLILYTIRIDIRCRIIHYIDLAMRHGNYRIDREAGEPDPHIVDLNSELGKCDEYASTALPDRERQFIFRGLESLMEQLLISNSRHIRVANEMGIKKIMRNMLALRQNSKTMSNSSKDCDFQRAKNFYGLFFAGPTSLLDSIKQEQRYSFDEYKAMINLQCGVDQGNADTGSTQATDRKYSMYVIELHGLELERSRAETS